MSNQSEDIQAAGFDTRPPMLDRIDFDSWQQRIRLYYKGKDHEEYILQVVADLSQAEKDRLRADIRAMNILLQGLPRDIYKLINHNTDAKDILVNLKMLLEGSELTKDDRESQLYDEFKHFGQHKCENIHDYYSRGDNTWFKETILGVLMLQVIRELSTELPKRPQNSDYFKEKMLLMQAQENKVDLDEGQLLFLVGGQTNTFDDEVDEGPLQDMAQNEDNIFQADQCDAFDSDVDEASTA
uniref:Gag-protease polyprotein n=1 Tax=Tanacetum cinerariifolium TaxID=118510 RepID=A0A699HMK2_TANCI|nr:Gag-protease polyprotein [Tanacetum cinerariifolium]